MTVNDMHEITFFWPRTDANYVIVTGTFDNWSKSIRLEKGSTGFSTRVNVPWNSTVTYKYFVDGRWTLDESKPRIIEPEGYINNVYVVPSKPSTPTLESAGTGGPGPTAGEEQVSGELAPNGHTTLDKPRQGYSSGQKIAVKDSSIAEAIMSVHVDRQQSGGESAVMANQNVPSRAENSTAGKQGGGLSDPASQPIDPSTESSVQGKTGEPSQQVEGKTTGEVSQTVASPEESRRSIHLPLVPVNVPSEEAPSGSVVADDTASTHKPLGPVNKPPATTSEIIPVTSHVPEGESAPTELEPKIPATTYIPTTEEPVGEGAGTPVGPESKPAEGEMPAQGGKELKESHPGEEAKAPLTQVVAPPNKPASLEISGDDQHAELVTLPKHAKANGTLASRSSNATSSDAATFPRVSHETSDSRSSKPLSKGSPRKKKSSFIQKIKHIFSHDKSKK
ncbi:hypothetical protein APHAL10511_002077 [Amanita phalloides]|nr:hypothetical protein APHAL10511_002077 [Amanita phalloides]